MTRKPTAQIPRRLAERQEVLFEKLQALTRQVQAAARQRPARTVPDDLRARAETMLFEVQPFRPSRGKPVLAEAAPHYGGLATQLAEALAALVAFEARHTHWDARVDAPAWVVPGPMMTLRRLGPRPGSKAAVRALAKAEVDKAARAAAMLDLRARLVQRLTQFKMRGVPTEADPHPASS
jgi:hypothetical protein